MAHLQSLFLKTVYPSGGSTWKTYTSSLFALIYIYPPPSQIRRFIWNFWTMPMLYGEHVWSDTFRWRLSTKKFHMAFSSISSIRYVNNSNCAVPEVSKRLKKPLRQKNLCLISTKNHKFCKDLYTICDGTCQKIEILKLWSKLNIE